MISILMFGCFSRSACKVCGRKFSERCVSMTPSTMDPFSPSSALRAFCTAASPNFNNFENSSYNTAPQGVRRTYFFVRTKSCIPSSSSRLEMFRLKEDCATNRWFAASVKFKYSATFKKHLIWKIVIVFLHELLNINKKISLLSKK